MNLQPGSHLPGGPLRNWQIGAVFIPFLLPLLLPLMVYSASKAPPLQMGSGIVTALSIVLVGLLFAIFIAGLVRSFPAWALPAWGIVLFLVSAFLQLAAQSMVFYAVMVPLYDGWPEGVAEKIGAVVLTLRNGYYASAR